MNDLLLDIWSDLRAKRLWPVALALLVGILAVPVVLGRSSEAPPPPSTPMPATAGAGVGADELKVKRVLAALDSKPLMNVSSLDQFKSKNPFKPLERLHDLEDAAGVVPATSDPTGVEGGAASTGDPASGGSGGGAVGGDTGGGSTGGETDTGGDEGSGKAPTPIQQYTYVLDLTFSDEAKSKRYRGFSRLSMLPSETNPLLVFLGVNANGTQAVFLVDSSLRPTGEGTCRPKPSECGFLYIEAGEEHYFTDDAGHAYTLRIDRVRKVRVEARDSSTSRVKARTSEEPDGPARRFQLFPPVLTDLIVGGQN